MERGAEHDLMVIASYGTLIEVWAGNFAEATQVADEAMERAEQGGGSLAHRILDEGHGGRLCWT